MKDIQLKEFCLNQCRRKVFWVLFFFFSGTLEKEEGQLGASPASLF